MKFVVLLLCLLFTGVILPAAEDFAVTDVRVFDGVTVREKASVLVRGGRIAAMGPALAIPTGVRVIDGRGLTLLPGLIDAHTHVIFRNALEQSLIFGVTTDIDMFTGVQLAREIHAEQAAGANPNRADMISCGTLATSPKGHGTEYGLVVPTLERPDQAQAFVDARIAEGSAFIKIIYGHGWKYPCLDKETLQALVAAAHHRGKLAVVHVDTIGDARDAVDAGADVLAHVWADGKMDEELVRRIGKRKVTVIPTLAVIFGINGLNSAEALLGEAAVSPYLFKSDASKLRQTRAGGDGGAESYGKITQAVRALNQAGVPILAGTDVPNLGTVYGLSLHQELELLVQAGLSPLQALGAATAGPAACFGLDDRGRIAVGKRADLLLVEGDPLRDITATRRIRAVWKEGVEVARDAYRARVEQERAAAGAAGKKPTLGGLISDFEDGTRGSRFGSGWQDSTDAILGGKSTVKVQVVAPGAADSQQALEVSGQVVPAAAYPWSGVIFFPTDVPFQAADLSANKEISFWIRGEVGSVALMFYARDRGFVPLVRPILVSPEWRQVTVPFAAVAGLDPSQVTAISICAGIPPGRTEAAPFRFVIDRIVLQ